eukprot:GILJ01010239.1.p1 GENE.GILJ01010239.1~~GILJ01010239.1.p1  ORF type:complete len:1179 (-),score=202.26 GILJ01010239.1:58-3594(-)
MAAEDGQDVRSLQMQIKSLHNELSLAYRELDRLRTPEKTSSDGFDQPGVAIDTFSPLFQVNTQLRRDLSQAMDNYVLLLNKSDVAQQAHLQLQTDWRNQLQEFSRQQLISQKHAEDMQQQFHEKERDWVLTEKHLREEIRKLQDKLREENEEKQTHMQTILQLSDKLQEATLQCQEYEHNMIRFKAEAFQKQTQLEAEVDQCKRRSIDHRIHVSDEDIQRQEYTAHSPQKLRFRRAQFSGEKRTWNEINRLIEKLSSLEIGSRHRITALEDLCIFASTDVEDRCRLIRADAIKESVRSLGSFDPGEKLRACYLIATLCKESVPGYAPAKQVGDLGGLHALVANLSEADQLLRIESLAAIEATSLVAENISRLLQLGSVPLLLTLVEDGLKIDLTGSKEVVMATEMLHFALRTLDNLANVTEGQARFRDCGGIPLVIRCLSRDDLYSRRHALGLVADLSLDAVTRQQLLDLGALATIVRAYRITDDLDTKRSGGIAVLNLSIVSEIKDELRKLGCLDSLVVSLSASDDLVRQYAAQALCNLAQNEENKLTLCRLGAVEPLVRQFGAEQIELRRAVTFCLASLSSSLGVELLVSKTVIPATLELIGASNQDEVCLRNVFNFYGNLLRDEDAMPNLNFVSADICKYIILTLQRNDLVPATRSAVIGTAIVLLTVAQARSILFQSGIIQYLLDAIKQHDSKLRRVSLAALAVVCREEKANGHSDVFNQITVLNGHQIILDILAVNESIDTKAIQDALRTIHSLNSVESNLNRFQELGSVPLVVQLAAESTVQVDSQCIRCILAVISQFADDPAHWNLLLTAELVTQLCLWIKSDDMGVKRLSLRCLSLLSRSPALLSLIKNIPVNDSLKPMLESIQIDSEVVLVLLNALCQDPILKSKVETFGSLLPEAIRHLSRAGSTVSIAGALAPQQSRPPTGNRYQPQVVPSLADLTQQSSQQPNSMASSGLSSSLPSGIPTTTRDTVQGPVGSTVNPLAQTVPATSAANSASTISQNGNSHVNRVVSTSATPADVPQRQPASVNQGQIGSAPSRPTSASHIALTVLSRGPAVAQMPTVSAADGSKAVDLLAVTHIARPLKATPSGSRRGSIHGREFSSALLAAGVSLDPLSRNRLAPVPTVGPVISRPNSRPSSSARTRSAPPPAVATGQTNIPTGSMQHVAPVQPL